TENNQQTPIYIDQGFLAINVDTRTARQKGLDTRRMRTICRKCNQQGHFNKDCRFLTEEERNKVQKPRGKRPQVPKGMDQIPLMRQTSPPLHLEEYITNLPCGMTVGQMIHWDPRYRKEWFR